MSDEAILRVADVSLSYQQARGPSRQILRQVDLSVAAGERVAVIGPSGCGKSSLLGLLAGLLQPTAGTMYFKGQPLLSPHEQISVILQDYGLFPWKTVAQNAALPLALRKTPLREQKARVQAVLEQMGIWAHRDQYPGQLSGGQRQRVAIARALISQPRVLLMDEPFSALDALTRESLQNVVRSLCEQTHMTMVLVTHNIEEAVFLGQRILVFASGAQAPTEVDNPAALGEAGRDSAGFYQLCATLRAMLGGNSDEK